MISPGLDLYYLLVESVFGSVFLSMFGILLIIFVTGILGRMDVKSILMISIIFIGVFMCGYVGALAVLPLFLFAIYYFISGAINWFMNMRS